MKAEERIEPSAREALGRAVAEAEGNEVFCIGETGADGRVRLIRTAARGDRVSVPALKPFLESGDVLIHNHPSGDLTPSRADLQVASDVGDQGIGFFIVDNPVENVYVVAEPVPVRRREELDCGDLASLLEPGGRLSVLFPEYEERRSQIDMLRMVCESFNADTLCVAEAGTGVGKSLAYLIPAMEWAQKNNERVVVSTATINLQHQLMENDIPLVRKLLGADRRAALVKGRGNYLCRYRLQESYEEQLLEEEANEELNAIRSWAQTTETGSLSDLPFLPNPEVWAGVCSEADSCLGLRCGLRDRCFVLRSRREAAAANILVVNHHLLFSDLAVRLSGIGFDSSAVLPPFQRVIFDEAHHVESSATSFFSESYSRFALRKQVGRIFRRRKGRRSGLILTVKGMLEGLDREKAERLPEMTEAIIQNAEVFDSLCLGLLGEDSSRLVRRGGEDFPLDEILPSLSGLEGELLSYCGTLRSVVEAASNANEEDDSLVSCRIVLRRLEQIAAVLDRFGRRDQYPEDIFWIERISSYRGEAGCRLIITPLSIAGLLRDAVIGRYPTVIFTSATLTVAGSFQYWFSRVGLDGETPSDSFPSPFRYRENVLLGVPVDAPLPTEPEYRSFLSAFIKEILKISEGRALVLFTSYSMLNETYEVIQEELSSFGIHVFRQGDDDRTRLLGRFREDKGSVLFATDSFWEGVDTPGEALEVLIVCRLPFRVPSEPIFKARTEDIEARGGNSFLQLSLPDAAIRLKQGFGRLMRRSTDGGVVLILDSRIVKRRYGEYLLASLPDASQKITESRFLMEAVEDFLVRRRS